MAKTPCSCVYRGNFGNLCVLHLESPTHPSFWQQWRHRVLTKSARVCESPGYTPGRSSNKLWAVIDEKVRAFVKLTKTWRIHKCGLAQAFLGQKHALAHGFLVKSDQNYGLRSLLAHFAFFGGLRVRMPIKRYIASAQTVRKFKLYSTTESEVLSSRNIAKYRYLE
jgi:hypothetical protein